MADSKAFVAKHGLAVNSPSTIVFGSNAKLHANNTITAGTITGAMLATGVAGTDDSTVLATNTALRALISAEADRTTLVNTNLTGTNTALRSLISDRLQVANATTLFLETGGSSGDEQSVGGQVTFSHNVIVSGNLTVSGTQTIINTNTLNVGDNIITLNSDETGTPSQNAGIEVERGSGTNVQLRWNETSDKWQFTNDGSSYEDIGAGITVQDEGSALSTAATTLNFVGSGVTASGTGATKTITIAGGDIVNDTTPQLGGTLDVNSQLINFGDSSGATDDRLNFGASQDLSIYHNGTNSIIENDTGYIDITGGETRISGTNGVMAFFQNTGGVTLQYTGSQKFETTNTGVNITGNIVVSGTVDGRDIATDGTKLDGIETGATDDATVLATNTAIRALVTTEANRNTLVNTNLTSTNTAIRALITAADLTGVKAETLLVKNPASHHTYTVTVASKTSAHPYTGQGSSSAYFLDGKEAPSIILAPNMTYRFDQADNTNSGHPLRFYLEADKTTAYTTGVTTNGTAGSSGAYTQIVVTDATPPVLYYQCSAHAYMGSVSSSLTEGTTDHLTEGSTNLYYTDARVNAHLNVSGASSGQILSWNGSDYAWVADQTGGGGSSLTVQDEGSALSTAATTLNFVGSGVTASGTGATKTITISGGGSALTVEDEGSALSTAATTLNFVGAGVTASGTGAEKTITINGTGSTTAYTPAPKYARLTLTSDQNLGSGSATSTITNYNTRAVDSSDSNALTSTLGDGKFIIPAGVSKVRLRASLEFSGTTDQVVMKFLKNGSSLPGSTNFEVQSTGGDYPAAFTGIIDVSQNDYFQVQIFHQSGTAIAETDANFSWFELEVVEGSILGGLGNLATLQDVHNASPTDGQALVWDNSNSYWAPGTVGAAITVQDEGSALSTSATTLNFVGAGVTASGSGATKTITISGGGSSGSTNLGGQFTSGTGNGSTTTFTSPINTNLANNLIVSVDGIMQRPTTDYTVSGTTVTFGTAPPSGTAVLVRSFSGAISSKADFTVQNFTANGSNTVYKLAESVSSGDHVLVSINGVIQRNTTDYTYNTGNGNITFDVAPTSGDIISFRTFDLQQSTSATVSDTAPTDPRNGDFWFDSSTAKLYMYYKDGSSNQWVSLSVPGAAGSDGADATPTVYANTSVLPSSGNSVGDFAFATLTKSLHVWDGSEWDRINAGGDENPRLTTVPASTLTLSGVTGANQSVTMVASDPEGFPITYSYDTNPASTNKASIVNHANGVFKIVPSTNSSHAGDFTLRLKASDGVHISSHAIACSLVFQTTITFDTSSSTINSTYTADNKVDVTVTASTIAINEQDLALGKGYLEYKIISDGNYPMMGLVAGSHNGTYGSNDALYIYHDGTKYPGGHGQSLSASGTNDIIMLAYDTAAGSHGKVWFGMNGTWQDSLSTSDVASGTGGHSFAAGDSNNNGLRVAFNSGGGGGDNYRIEIISHTQGAQYTIPSGFTLA